MVADEYIALIGVDILTTFNLDRKKQRFHDYLTPDSSRMICPVVCISESCANNDKYSTDYK